LFQKLERNLIPSVNVGDEFREEWRTCWGVGTFYRSCVCDRHAKDTEFLPNWNKLFRSRGDMIE